jgi:tetratricopeptide (TPR) repeat protein
MTDPVFERYKEALKAGHVAVMRGRPKDALERYAEAARLADHRPLPHVSMGSVLLQLGRSAEALAAYDRAIERDPGDRQALSGRAAALLAAGRRADAAEALARVAELEETATRRRTDASAARADTVAREDDPEALLATAEDAWRADEPAAALDAFVAAARAYGRRGADDAAIDACLRAMSIRQGDPAVHLEMARRYFARGWADRATDRLVLLDRLLVLDGQDSARADVAAVAAEHVDADPRLAALVADPSPSGVDAASA